MLDDAAASARRNAGGARGDHARHSDARLPGAAPTIASTAKRRANGTGSLMSSTACSSTSTMSMPLRAGEATRATILSEVETNQNGKRFVPRTSRAIAGCPAAVGLCNLAPIA